MSLFEGLFNGLLGTRVEFAVYRVDQDDGDAAVWPASYRRLLRSGMCALVDLEAQVFSAGEAVVAINEDADPDRHAISLMPYPHVVPQPERE